MNMTYTYPINTILLLGPTGVGKSPLGDAIAQNGLFGRKSSHLDFGSELRDAVSNKERSAFYSGEEITFIHGVLEQGLLLENEHFSLARKIISLFLDRAKFSQRDLLVLNGIPRHVGQAHDMTAIAAIHALVVLDCSAEDVIRRIRDNVGGDRTERVDDALELVEKKLETFWTRTAPLVDHYEKKGRRIYRLKVSGIMTPATAYENISALAARYPPIAFITEPPQR
jgi:adenylate kinase